MDTRLAMRSCASWVFKKANRDAIIGTQTLCESAPRHSKDEPSATQFLGCKISSALSES